MTPFVYRLQPLLRQKEEARTEAERELTRREKELEAELEQLHLLERRERELSEKRSQLRHDMLAKAAEGPTLTAREVQDRAAYVKALGTEIEEAKNDIAAQGVIVKQCEAYVRTCRERVEEARREVEVLTKHRSKQEGRFLRELQAKEELALDEVGNAMYSARKGSI